VTRGAVRFLALAAAALALAACSLSKLAYTNVPFAYSNATPMLAWMAGDYVEMTGEQKDWVRERIASAFAWHRAQELPHYQRFFERVLEQSQDNISVEEARDAHRALRMFYYRTLERLIPDLAEFLSQLDAEQVAQLERKFAKDNRKFATESTKGTPQERRERRASRLLDYLEEFTGRLSSAQRAMVAERVAAMPELVDEQLAERSYRQGELMALVRANPPREKWTTELRRLLIESESWRRPDYQAKLRARDQQMFEMIAALSASLTAEQRTYFQARVRGFMRDISELTAAS
jgi:hypothetical protein